MPTRREFLASSALSAVALHLGDTTRRARTAPARGFIDLLRPPDLVAAQTDTAYLQLDPNRARWTKADIEVTTAVHANALNVQLSSPSTAIKRVHLRWRGDLSPTQLILGDAWERGYGDLEWRGWVPDRVMPWYAATFDGAHTHIYGVRTSPRAFCFWQLDPEGVSLWTDVRSGGAPIMLGQRTLDVCGVVCRQGKAHESSWAALRAFCAQMCPNPRTPSLPIYGSNDWYWAYGQNSAATVLADAQHIVELSPVGANRPFVVIDDGWQPGRGVDKSGAGMWNGSNEKFPDMAQLAADIRKAGARPGIWYRPLQAPSSAPDDWRLSRDRATLDPTQPAALARVHDDVARLRAWGYELIKHDYSTYDIFGRWGFQMGAAMTRDGWTWSSGPTRTTAEVIDDLYKTIRDAAGDALVLGCNTVSHLSAGRFELCRIGDDTSGTDWSRTRKMGVNSLAFRGAQQGSFYAADADCVGVTNAVPWSETSQWLDLVARSGTPLFVSLAPDALGAVQRRDLKAALALAAVAKPVGEPLNWQHNVYPWRWRLLARERSYDWVAPDGAGPP